jgi:hypothetical protein
MDTRTHTRLARLTQLERVRASRPPRPHMGLKPWQTNPRPIDEHAIPGQPMTHPPQLKRRRRPPHSASNIVEKRFTIRTNPLPIVVKGHRLERQRLHVRLEQLDHTRLHTQRRQNNNPPPLPNLCVHVLQRPRLNRLPTTLTRRNPPKLLRSLHHRVRRRAIVAQNTFQRLHPSRLRRPIRACQFGS